MDPDTPDQPDAPAIRIMLVEDEFLIRITLAEVLTDEGYDVLEADTGDEALRMLAGNPVELLLTDIQLPGKLDGHGLVQEARRLLPHLPVIFMTGRPDAVASRRLRPDEAFVAKPYLPSDICRAIKLMLGQPKT